MTEEMDFETLELQRELKRGKFTMRLDTMLLFMTLAGVVLGFVQARSSSMQWHSHFNRIATASALPEIRDATKMEFVIEEYFSTPAWTIWVPYGKTCRVRVATQKVDRPFPEDFDEYLLSAGRHTIGVTTSPSNPILQLKLDGIEILEKKKTRTWNVAGVPETILTDSVQSTSENPVVLFRRFGRIRPNREEEREMRKHRVGLMIWVQP